MTSSCKQKPVGVFWDFENVHLSSETMLEKIITKIRTLITQQFGYIAKFQAYADVKYYISPTEQKILHRTGVRLLDVPKLKQYSGEKSFVEKALLTDICFFISDVIQETLSQQEVEDVEESKEQVMEAEDAANAAAEMPFYGYIFLITNRDGYQNCFAKFKQRHFKVIYCAPHDALFPELEDEETRTNSEQQKYQYKMLKSNVHQIIYWEQLGLRVVADKKILKRKQTKEKVLQRVSKLIVERFEQRKETMMTLSELSKSLLLGMEPLMKEIRFYYFAYKYLEALTKEGIFKVTKENKKKQKIEETEEDKAASPTSKKQKAINKEQDYTLKLKLLKKFHEKKNSVYPNMKQMDQQILYQVFKSLLDKSNQELNKHAIAIDDLGDDMDIALMGKCIQDVAKRFPSIIAVVQEQETSILYFAPNKKRKKEETEIDEEAE